MLPSSARHPFLALGRRRVLPRWVRDADAAAGRRINSRRASRRRPRSGETLARRRSRGALFLDRRRPRASRAPQGRTARSALAHRREHPRQSRRQAGVRRRSATAGRHPDWPAPAHAPHVGLVPLRALGQRGRIRHWRGIGIPSRPRTRARGHRRGLLPAAHRRALAVGRGRRDRARHDRRGRGKGARAGEDDTAQAAGVRAGDAAPRPPGR